VTKEKIQRINELAKKSRVTGLSEEEKLEQKNLRNEYLEDYRKNFISVLDNTYIKNPDGTEEKLKRKASAEKN